MKIKVVAAAAVAVFALAAAWPALAGFRIQEVDPEFPEDVTTSWFQGGRARIDGALEGLSVIVDVKNGEGWLVDNATKRFAGGKISEIVEELKKVEDTQSGEAATGGPGDQEAAAEPSKPRVVEVRELGTGERLQGYETRRCQVLVDKELLEELWLAPKLEVAREVDLTAFGVAMQKMLGGAGLGQGYEESEAYRKLRAGGYPLRQVLYFVGEKSTIEVKAVAMQDLPDSDFAVPKGFSKVGYAELLLGEGE